MCGRYVLSAAASVLRELFRLERAADFIPRWNIAPTQSGPVVRVGDGSVRELANLRWGFVPEWSETVAAAGGRMINARSETAATTRAFCNAMRTRRCVIPADGFYEWQGVEGSTRKRPHYICARDRQPLALAGLWERWRGGDTVVDSYTILTTAANEHMRSLHARMPVILRLSDVDRWLDPKLQDAGAVDDLLRPSDGGLLESWQVSTAVNRPQNEGQELIEPAPSQEQGGLWPGS